jgi:predicted phosphohydrolase
MRSIKVHEYETLLYGIEYWTIKARDARRITATEMKYMRRTVGKLAQIVTRRWRRNETQLQVWTQYGPTEGTGQGVQTK